MSDSTATPALEGGLAEPFRSQALQRPATQACLAGLTAFLVYLLTLSPSIGWGDSAELTTAAGQAGVPHPTGYPLYMLVGHAFLKLIPFGSVAFRMNVLSALCGAVAVGALNAAARRVLRSSAGAWIAAMLFALSATFWSQCVVAEVYAAHMLFTAVVLATALRWEHTGSRRDLRIAVTLYGLSFTHHLMSVLLAPALLYLAFTSRRGQRWMRDVPVLLALFLLPLLLYAYLPWAAWRDPPANWGDPRSWANLVDHVTGAQYRGVMFSKGVGGMVEAFGRYLGEPEGRASGHLRRQFPVALILIAVPGGLWLLARRRRAAICLLLLLGTTLAYATNYAIYDVEVYFLPAHMVTAILIAAGLLGLRSRIRLVARVRLPRARRVVWGGLTLTAACVTPVFLLLGNWPAASRQGDTSPLVYGRAALDSFAANSVVLIGGDDMQFPLLYCRYVEGRRPDVTLVNLYSLLLPERTRLLTRQRREGLEVNIPDHFARAPRGVHDDNCLPVRLVADNIGRRPLYVLGPDVLLQADWVKGFMEKYFRTRTVNLACFRLQTEPPQHALPTPGVSRARFDLPGGGIVELTNLRLSRRQSAGVSWTDVGYDWSLSEDLDSQDLEPRLIFGDADGNFVTGADGEPLLQDRRPLGGVAGAPRGSAYRLPRRFTDRATLYLPPGLERRPLHAWLGLSRAGEAVRPAGANSDFVSLGELPPAPE